MELSVIEVPLNVIAVNRSRNRVDDRVGSKQVVRNVHLGSDFRFRLGGSLRTLYLLCGLQFSGKLVYESGSCERNGDLVLRSQRRAHVFFRNSRQVDDDVTFVVRHNQFGERLLQVVS